MQQSLIKERVLPFSYSWYSDPYPFVAGGGKDDPDVRSRIAKYFLEDLISNIIRRRGEIRDCVVLNHRRCR